MTLDFSQQIFEKFTNIKFHENSPIGSRAVPGGRTDRRMGGKTDMMKSLTAFPYFANAPKSRV